jgi:hypothetical protein
MTKRRKSSRQANSKKRRPTLVRRDVFPDGAEVSTPLVDVIEQLLGQAANAAASNEPTLRAIGRRQLREVAERLATMSSDQIVVENQRRKATEAAAKARRQIGEKTKQRVLEHGEDAPVGARHRRRIKNKK